MLSALPSATSIVSTSSLAAPVIKAFQSRLVNLLPASFNALRMLSSVAAVAAPASAVTLAPPLAQQSVHAPVLASTTLARRPSFHLAPLHRGWVNDPVSIWHVVGMLCLESGTFHVVPACSCAGH